MLSQSPPYVVNNAIWSVRVNEVILSTLSTYGVTNMKRYVIERYVPGIGSLNREQLKEAAATSNSVLARLSGKAQWVQSFVVDDKTFCIYLADSEASVQEHARLSGFPANKVTEVRSVIDPMTAIS